MRTSMCLHCFLLNIINAYAAIRVTHSKIDSSAGGEISVTFSCVSQNYSSTHIGRMDFRYTTQTHHLTEISPSKQTTYHTYYTTSRSFNCLFCSSTRHIYTHIHIFNCSSTPTLTITSPFHNQLSLCAENKRYNNHIDWMLGSRKISAFIHTQLKTHTHKHAYT